MENLICVLFTSLRYEPVPDKIEVMTREKLSRIRYEKKNGQYCDWLIQRVTYERFCIERDRIEREKFNAEYDKAIMTKYNVDKNYSQNRWFMEQVRPSAY